ncbi:hypothetical protein BCV70DRAFT_206498 [Testicularia cyperi]|uniref:Uncharacterized protein n=1 Tax=Testicularia cyperi TaxID=1882483 RepID=A0A317XR16_9BASI|nr:hypothetical protein BCV70DRAFT_206498 [Testicularia cyperi]
MRFSSEEGESPGTDSRLEVLAAYNPALKRSLDRRAERVPAKSREASSGVGTCDVGSGRNQGSWAAPDAEGAAVVELDVDYPVSSAEDQNDAMSCVSRTQTIGCCDAIPETPVTCGRVWVCSETLVGCGDESCAAILLLNGRRVADRRRIDQMGVIDAAWSGAYIDVSPGRRRLHPWPNAAVGSAIQSLQLLWAGIRRAELRRW